MPPPAKRQKRLVLLSSEDEEEEQRPSRQEDGSGSRKLWRPQHATLNNTCVLPTRLRSDNKIQPFARAPSPKKVASKLKTTAPLNNSKPSSLDTYLSTANGIHKCINSASQSQKPRVAVDDEDFIEDDSFGEELRKLTDSRKGIRGGEKEALSQSQSQAEKKPSSRLPTGSQKFRGLGNSPATVNKTEQGSKQTGGHSRPWADRYGPISTEELAVHKKKVADVRDWLESVFSGQSKKVSPQMSTLRWIRLADVHKETFDTQGALWSWQDCYSIYACSRYRL